MRGTTLEPSNYYEIVIVVLLVCAPVMVGFLMRRLARSDRFMTIFYMAIPFLILAFVFLRGAVW